MGVHVHWSNYISIFIVEVHVYTNVHVRLKCAHVYTVYIHVHVHVYVGVMYTCIICALQPLCLMYKYSFVQQQLLSNSSTHIIYTFGFSDC